MTNSDGEYRPELMAKKLIVVPFDDGEPKNCVEIPEGKKFELNDIIKFAMKHEAWIDNSEDQSADDIYAIQFPDHEQELLKELNSDDDIE
jgi:hypothetical protein